MSFGDDDGRKSRKKLFPTVEIKYYNILIDGKKLFDQPIKNDLKTYDNIRKILTGQGNEYMTEFLLDFPYFKKIL